MQLKRILARDTRTATDKAIALYGSDVLIISNHLVNGQTELVVALDLPETESAATASAVRAVSLLDVTPQKSALSDKPKPESVTFRDTLIQAEWKASPSAQTEPKSNAQTSEANPQDARDYLRGREIVDLVRDELALIRREFRLNQQTTGWQSGLTLVAGVQPLARALSEASIPQELRALLLDTLKDHATPEQALQALKAQLTHSLERPAVTLPTDGVHLLAGPSGAGKTLMIARLARHAEALHGAHQVAVISYQDVRAGAWSQTQMLASQLGIDSFRAGDAGTLALLLNELAPRQLVLIDTPGVQMNDRVAEVLAIQADCGCHAVVPADASSATLAKLIGSGIAWHSLLVSKVDESSQPWPLLHFLSNNLVGLSGASDGVRGIDLILDFPVQKLVALGLAQLQATTPKPADKIAEGSVERRALRQFHLNAVSV
jgi:flagellar biosynthesis GTPase FlhF